MKNNRYTNILMGTVQGAIANGVLDAVRAGDIPKDKVDDLGIIVSVWLNPSVADDDNLDHRALFDIHREATAKAIHKAMNHEPSIDWAELGATAVPEGMAPEEWQEVWPILLRGLQMCSHETFMDCPYYEQLQALAIQA